MNIFDTYFKAVQEMYLADNESSEHTYRTAFQNLLSSFVAENIGRRLIIKHEPTKQADKGRPDFKVTTAEQLTIGLIETKKIGEDLRKILATKQLANYKQLSDNIIVTDYLQFYLIKNGEPIFNTTIFADYNLKNKKFKVEHTRIDELTKLFALFFESEPETIYRTQDLAVKLSEKAKFLREYCNDELNRESEEENLLQGLFTAFKDTLLPLLDNEYFADIYAQTLTYGLFLAALNCDDPLQMLNKDAAYRLLPNTFPLIKELFHRLDEFPAEIVWAVDEIISILKVTDFAAIKKEFAEYRRKEQGFNDPFIFFYEDFLKHYDKNQRELRGVYYTPESVVSYIVRSIEIILKKKFQLFDGLISDEVTLLDFATGTGTFLLNSFKHALEEARKFGDKYTVNKILNDRIIGKFYGFELLVAPYVVAHLKISEFLKEEGFLIDAGKRLNIYLTNTLTNNEPHPFPILPNLSKEGKEANKIKNKDILIILGNPPYSGHSANIDDWIKNEMKIYYEVDGKALGEKNPKWLQDDYVKFIRFAQWKMDKMDRGAIGIITNHSYLDNPTFRGMRQSLLKSFNEIYIIDLHGNAKKKEKSPDGSKDENVFDIQQGVAIAIFIKTEKNPKSCRIYHYDLFGLRQNKYNTLQELNITNTDWKEISPKSPFYLFVPRNEELLEKYNRGLNLHDIFKINSVGIVTARDEFVIDTNITNLKQKILDFKELTNSDEEIKAKYSLAENAKFDIEKKRGIIAKLTPDELNNKFSKILYRPFDSRFIFYHDALIERARKNIMVNMQEENIALCIGRQWSTVGSESFDVVFVSNNIVDFNLFRRGGENLFPLYILSNGEDRLFFGMKEPEVEYNADNKTKSGLTKTPNFTKEFQEFINNQYKISFSPEQIMGYIYAVLHSPTYRNKYVGFLKIDFPRIPFTDDEELFKELSAIGEELISHHLLKVNYSKNICKIDGDSDNFKVEKVSYEPDSMKVWINKDRYFAPVPPEIWNFYIGGYQVLDKWLKERKKHDITLSGEDVQHFIKVVNVLGNTIETMQKIDELTKDWI